MKNLDVIEIQTCLKNIDVQKDLDVQTRSNNLTSESTLESSFESSLMKELESSLKNELDELLVMIIRNDMPATLSLIQKFSSSATLSFVQIQKDVLSEDKNYLSSLSYRLHVPQVEKEKAKEEAMLDNKMIKKKEVKPGGQIPIPLVNEPINLAAGRIPLSSINLAAITRSNEGKATKNIQLIANQINPDRFISINPGRLKTNRPINKHLVPPYKEKHIWLIEEPD